MRESTKPVGEIMFFGPSAETHPLSVKMTAIKAVVPEEFIASPPAQQKIHGFQSFLHKANKALLPQICKHKT